MAADSTSRQRVCPPPPVPARNRAGATPVRLPECPSPRAALDACAVPMRCAGWCARQRCPPTTSCTRCSSCPAAGVREGDPLAARASSTCRSTRPAARGRGGGQARHPVGAAVRPAREEGRGRQRGLAPRRAWCSGRSGPSRRRCPDLAVAADACFCEYTTHGHCGVLLDRSSKTADVDNDATLENLGRAALSYAQAGADIVAPSGMMDGMIGFLREIAGRGRVHGRHPAVLRREIRVGVLRPVP